MDNNIYKNYFKNHYGAMFFINDTQTQIKFLYNQLKFCNKIVNLNRFKHKDILEIGSGLGAIAKLLIDSGFENYQGIEMDNEVVSFTNRKIKNCFTNESLEDFAKKKLVKKYSLIIAFEVLEHLKDPMECIKIIKNLLSDDGVFIGTSPFPYKKNVFADETHRYVLHPENWRNLFLSNKYKKVTIYPMSFLPLIWRINKHLNFRIPFYIPFKYFISTTLIIAYK